MYDPFGLRFAPFIYQVPDLEKEYQAMVEEVKGDLASMIKKERTEGMDIKEMVKDAEPVHEILRVVEAEKSRLLIMAAHKETRIEHIMYGWINHEIVRRLPYSVFLVKGKYFRAVNQTWIVL